MCAPSYNQETYQGILILIWNHAVHNISTDILVTFCWKLLLGAAKVIFSISELSTVESHHRILNRSFVFVIIKENWWRKEASEESILGFKIGFHSMPRECMMTLFPEGYGFYIGIGLIPQASVGEVGPRSKTQATASLATGSLQGRSAGLQGMRHSCRARLQTSQRLK